MTLAKASLTAIVVLQLNLPLLAQWAPQPSGTDARLRGLCVVGPKVGWAGGTGGTFVRTADGGLTWQAGTVAGASALDFRAVWAADDRTAYLLSAGLGPLSTIRKSTDGGATWTVLLTNPDPSGFLDAIAFADPDHGLALGDPVDGRFVIFKTDDGKAWRKTPAEGLPRALPGEGAYAASGTCLVRRGGRLAWFGTGGARVSRVFRTTDGGETWSAHETPVVAGLASAGIFSLAFRDADHGVAIGGDYKLPDAAAGVVARTDDGGRTWSPIDGDPPSGFRSAVAYLPGGDGRSLVAVGPNGSDLSTDDGRSWRRIGRRGFHAVGLVGPPAAGWAVGDGGSIAAFAGPAPAGSPPR